MGLRNFIQSCIRFKNKYYLRELGTINSNLKNIGNYLDIITRGSNTSINSDRNPIQSVEVKEGYRFIGSVKDECIIPYMRSENTIWEYENMEYIIHNILKKKSDNSIILDIGANIGTTSVYFAGQMGVNVIAFEPDADNYKMLKCNCVLNNVDKMVNCENIALSNKNEERMFEYNIANPGKSKIIDTNEVSGNVSCVKTLRLDDYLNSNDINAEKISFIWMDVEGFEVEVIEGALNSLKKKPIPLFMEVNWIEYKKKNLIDTYIDYMSSIYTHFMDVRNENIKWLPISSLRRCINSLKEEGREQTDYLFVKKA